MKHSEKEKYIKNARKSVGRKYKFRQSDYVNWKIKDGFFFCLVTFTLKETIQQSPVEEHYYQRSLLVREWVAKGVPEMDYECLPAKCVDHIPMEWFKAAEYVLLEREEYLSLNACMVKNLAGNAYRQSVLDGLI